MKVTFALFAAMVRASRLACPPREWQHAPRVQARALQPDQVGGPSFAGGKPAATRLRSRRHPRENPARRRQHRVTTPTQARSPARPPARPSARSEEHTSELQTLMRISYAV